jgi:processive 1,2-diacylglycerol beta-glucosyltransferase
MHASSRADVVILYTSVGGGHRAAANAVADAIARERPGTRTEVLDSLDFAPASLRRLYLWLYRLLQLRVPHAWDWLYACADRMTPSLVADRVRVAFDLAVMRRLGHHLEATQPAHVVCTHHLPAVVAGDLAERRRIGSRVTVVVTDHAAHHAWVCRGVDAWYAADEAVARSLVRRGVDRRAVRITGIPVRPTLAAPVVPVPRHPRVARVLLLCSGVPARLAAETLASFRGCHGLVLDVVAGADAAQQVALRAQANALDVTARVRAPVPDLAPLIDAADVVVSKAGGLTTAECLARGRGVVLPWHAPGQERANMQHLLRTGAAVTAVDHHDTGRLVAGLAATPGALTALGLRAHAAARPHAARDVARHLLGAAPPVHVRPHAAAAAPSARARPATVAA